ncbi:MAG: hypothetical protein GX414_00005, partial [Acidobacteria bacterium]|nr:hypothetical protein [Acidobacteriota bacterium]
MNDSVVRFQPSSSYDEALARAGAAWGIEAEYWDIWGKHHVPSAEARQAVLRSLGVPCETREQLDQALEERLWLEWATPTTATVVASDSRPAQLALNVPEEFSGGVLHAELTWENGESAAVSAPVASLPLLKNAELRGR